jgi:cobalt-zinc-cadmium efflux system membrane fusion protein
MKIQSNMKNINYFLVLGAIFIVACTTDNTEVADNSKSGVKTSIENVVFTKISKQLITDVVECTGRIDVPPNQRASVYAPIGGMVNNIKILPGDLVKKGQLLFDLSHQDIVKIQQDYLQAKSNYLLYEVNLERKQKLYNAESISEREYRTAQHEFSIGEATLNSLRVQLSIIGISSTKLESKGISSSIHFRAPITGYISEVSAVSGSFVDINQPILTIVNTEHKHVELDVYADNIYLVKVGQHVGFHTAGSEIEHQAEIQLVGKEVHEDTRTVRVHAHLDGNSADNLVIGTYLYAGILINSDSVYSLPISSIVKIADVEYVLVKEGNSLSQIKVDTGKSFKNFVEIKNSDLLIGKDIVSEDAYYLME